MKGRPGEFRVVVDGATVLKKGWFSLPREEKVLEAVRAAITGDASSR